MSAAAFTSQLTLDLHQTPTFRPGDFFPSESNRAALAWVQRWPNWPSTALVLYGPSGCGKTHLAHVWQEKTNAPFITLESLQNISLLDFCEAHPALILDNYVPLAQEELMFHLLNAAKEQGTFLLVLSQKAPMAWDHRLPDLSSRLKAAPNIAIEAPDDVLLRAVILKLFADRQVKVGEDVITYLLKRIERSFEATQKAIDQINSYALMEQRRITLPLVQTALAV